MKWIAYTLSLLVSFSAVSAQQTSIEITKPTTEYDDSKPNSDAVPDVYALTDQFQRIVVLRFKHKTDLLEGLKQAAAEENIRNAVILAGIGSARSYHFHMVSNRDFPSKNIYIKDPTDPADILSLNGYIIDGRVHAHITLSDEEKAFGGHLEEGTNIFTFAVVTIGVFSDDFDLKRVDDKTYR